VTYRFIEFCNLLGSAAVALRGGLLPSHLATILSAFSDLKLRGDVGGLSVIGPHSASLFMLCYVFWHWGTFGIFGYVMFLVVGTHSVSLVMLCFLSLTHIRHLWLCYFLFIGAPSASLVMLCFLSLAHVRHLRLCYVSCHWRTFSIFGYVMLGYVSCHWPTFGIFGYVMFLVTGVHSTSLVMLYFMSLAHIRHLWLCYVSCHWRTFDIFGCVMFLVTDTHSTSLVT
jgi:hypothetical protein